MFNILFKTKSEYQELLENFKNSTEKTIIENIIHIKKYIFKKSSNTHLLPDCEELKYYIIFFTNKYIENKNIVSSLKSFSIFINKIYNINNFILKKINYIIKLSNNPKLNKSNIFKKEHQSILSNILTKIDESSNMSTMIKTIIEQLIKNDDTNNLLKAYPYLLKIINSCKKTYPFEYQITSLEKILYKCDNNIYKYTYFLYKNIDINNKELVIKLLKNFNFENMPNTVIDNIELKRGFIQNFINLNNGKNYILKYQPNRSIMELIINIYLKHIIHENKVKNSMNTCLNTICNNDKIITTKTDITNDITSDITTKLNSNPFLLPDYFFINSDCSYCYLIKKYETDLYKYFSIIYENNEIIKFVDIINILKFMITAIKFLYNNSIIHGDLKLENIVINYKIDNNNILITDLKIIDFDVSLFETIPDVLNPIPDEFNKTLNNKKIRGTKIYLLNDKCMSHKNDIYSMGVIFLIILYKNIKIFALIKKKSIENDNSQKKLFIKCNTFLKNINTLRNEITIDENKYKMLDLIYDFIKSVEISNFYTTINDQFRFPILIDFIKDCLKTRYNIIELEGKYSNLLSQM